MARKAALVLAALLLPACAGEDAPSQVCPEAGVVAGADRLVRFVGSGRDLTDVGLEARIEIAPEPCDYNDGVIEMPLTVRLVASRGPAAGSEALALDYFVAIATLEREVVARESFRVELPFTAERSRLSVVEEVLPKIPLRGDESGADYRIYVGLGLEESELSYNRGLR